MRRQGREVHKTRPRSPCHPRGWRRKTGKADDLPFSPSPLESSEGKVETVYGTGTSKKIGLLITKTARNVENLPMIPLRDKQGTSSKTVIGNIKLSFLDHVLLLLLGKGKVSTDHLSD